MKTYQPRSKVSVTLPSAFVAEVDELVQKGNYANRSAALEDGLRQLLRARMDARIEAEVSKLEREREIAEAEEGVEAYADLLRE